MTDTNPSANTQEGGNRLPSSPAPGAKPKTGIFNLLPSDAPRAQANSGPGSQLVALRKTVLIASYDLDLALRLKPQFSQKNDLRTVIVSSFAETLRHVNEMDLTLLLLDFSIESVKEGLPEVDNMYALREIRKLPKGARLPVICAAAVESTAMVSCLIQGYSAFLKRSHLEQQMWKYVDQFLTHGKLDLNRPL